MPNPRLMQLSLRLSSRFTTAEVKCPSSGAKVVATTREPFLADLYRETNLSAATHVGRTLAQRLKESGVGHIYLNYYSLYYHGKVRAILDQLREGGVVVHSEPYLEAKHLHAASKELLRGQEFNPLPHDVKTPLEYFPSSLDKVKVKRRVPFNKENLLPLFPEDVKVSSHNAPELHPLHPDHPNNKNKAK